MKAREKIWKLIKTKILGAKVRYRLFLSKIPCSFWRKYDKIPHGRIFWRRCKKEDEEYAADGI